MDKGKRALSPEHWRLCTAFLVTGAFCFSGCGDDPPLLGKPRAPASNAAPGLDGALAMMHRAQRVILAGMRRALLADEQTLRLVELTPDEPDPANH